MLFISRREARVIVLFCCFLVTFLLLEGRVAYLQIYKGKELAAYAVKGRTISLRVGNFYRGDILDQQGRSLLDRQIKYDLAVFPALIEPSASIQQLESLLPDNWQSSQPFLLSSHLSEEEASELLSQNVSGVYPVPINQYYGPGALARHLVGYASGSLSLGKALEGSKGIEKLYDTELAPPDPTLNLGVVVDRKGEAIKGRGVRLRGAKGTVTRGKDVVLTIDRDVQEIVENILDNHNVKGAAALIDIPSGEIRALASRPSYSYHQGKLEGEEFDRSLASYHPGSVFKIVVAAAALSEKVVDPAEKFNCTGKYVYKSGEEISCWKEEGHGELTFREAFANSCNSVFVEVALRLGPQKLMDYSRLLGLEEGIVGYSLPGFRGGVVQFGNLPGQVGNAALGQEGVSISPVNLAALAATVGAGGVYQKPTLVKEIRDHSGKTDRRIQSTEPRRVLSDFVIRELQGMMELVVTDGTGKRAQVPELGSAGKTGSAETGKNDEQGPVVDAWFVGYTPLQNPQLAAAVFIEGGGTGGGQTAIIFKEIVEALQKK